MKSIYTTKSPEETMQLGERLASHLNGHNIILLFGDLGSGKTHLAKGIASGLGVTEKIKSPTYVYVNQLKIKNEELKIKTLYHYDLYRLNKGGDTTSIGLEESFENSSALNVVEWADRLEEMPEKYVRVEMNTTTCHSGLDPKSKLDPRVKPEDDNGEEVHQISIEFIDPEIVPENKIQDFYEEWMTPMHVRDHCKQVTEVAVKLGQAFIDAGEIIDLNLLYSAGMLHDTARVCDFKELKKDGFEEEITDEKWQKWEQCREAYKNVHHAIISSDFLRQLGYHQTAEVVRLHRSRCIVEEPESFDTLEKKIMFYADKRVMHRHIVSLKKRFEDGWERYGKDNDEATQKLFKEVERKTFELEEELFEGLGIKPVEIN